MTFELGQEGQIANITRPTINDLNTSSLAQIAQLVASTGQLFNIVDLNQWSNEHPEINVDDELKQTQAVLCMPIFNGQKNVIGVVQLINKVRKLLLVWLCSKKKKENDRIATEDPTDCVEFIRLVNVQEDETSFTDTDVSIIEAFAIFCGLGIHNTQMYENACKLMAKQKVALECLSYHATATQTQTMKLVQDTIQSAEDYALYSFKFIGKPRKLPPIRFRWGFAMLSACICV